MQLSRIQTQEFQSPIKPEIKGKALGGHSQIHNQSTQKVLVCPDISILHWWLVCYKIENVGEKNKGWNYFELEIAA